MATKVIMEIITRGTMKPSSPTPDYLQNYKLSFLDKLNAPHYTPSILFYESNPNIKSSNIEKSNQLKASLCKTLSCFYPLAGRLVINESVHCNDEGVSYIEAQTRSKLSEIIHNPNFSEFEKFLPRAVDNFHDNVLLAIQVNFFDCGGLSIGVCISHKLADASSRMMFLNSWAANLRAHSDLVNIIHPPIFESATLFPPRDHMPFSQKKDKLVEAENKTITKMFVFNGPTLKTFRKRYSDETNQECLIRATRVEALTAFLMKIYAIDIKKVAKNYTVIHAVNLRSRMEPALSKYHFGNFYAVAQANYSSVEEIERRGEFVRKMRGAIKDIDGKYVVDNIRDGNNYLDLCKEITRKRAMGELNGLTFSSGCRTPFYEVDFGWGKPVMVGLTDIMSKNIVRLLDAKDGNGIEAWISMEEEDIAKLESNQEFLSYVSSTVVRG